MRKRCLSLLFLLLLTLPAGGCLKKDGLDHYAYVVALGFDPGEHLPYRYTFLLQQLDYGSSEQKLSGLNTVSAEGSNLFEAINTLAASMPLRLSFVRTVLLVFERSLLTDGRFLAEFMQSSFPTLGLRFGASVLVSLCPADMALEGMETDLDPGAVKLQKNIEVYSRDTALIPAADLALVQEAMLSSVVDFAAPLCGTASDAPGQMQDSVGGEGYAYLAGNLLAETDMKTEVIGAALFSNCVLVGVLNGQNTQLLQMATGNFYRARIRLGNIDGTEIDVYLKRRKPVKIELEPGDPPCVRIRLELTAYIEQPDHLKRVTTEQAEQWIAEQLTQRYNRLYQTCRELRSDVFGVGKQAARWFSGAEEYETYDFRELYAAAEAVFDVRVLLTNAPDRSVLE